MPYFVLSAIFIEYHKDAEVFVARGNKVHSSTLHYLHLQIDVTEKEYICL